jgi:DnaJ homolog subfamily C member 8
MDGITDPQIMLDPQNRLKELQQKEKELSNLASNLSTTKPLKDKNSAEYHLNRLLNETYINPYDILQIPAEANDLEIKKMYRELSLKVHPDKCSHDKAADVFNMVDSAYKMLMDPEKRRIYQRIMREARERVEYEREKENEKRKKVGKTLLPMDTFNVDVQAMCKRLFDQIEENKEIYERADRIKRKRMHREMETQQIVKEIEKEDEREWEENRDKRVKKWRKFAFGNEGKDKKRVSKFLFKAPKVRMESRPNSAPKTDQGRPMGIDTNYKRQWK